MTISSVGSTTPAYQASTTNSFDQLFNDFKGIGSDIQSGDLSSAQSALTAFQSDLQNSNGKDPISQLFSNNSTLGNDLTALQTALQSNDPAAAQNAFKTLTQDMQGAHHHHHHHARSASATTTSSDTNTDPTTGSSSTGSTLNVQT